ncbi:MULTISPECIES: hypothetical protein [Nostocales]|uniref:Uncharacterized protein n=2 Tax=Nostocales TaxID=1161 RepID=A0ABW8WWD0_9CYAN
MGGFRERLFQHFRTITAGIKELKLYSDREEAFFQEELTYTAKSARNYRVTSLKIFPRHLLPPTFTRYEASREGSICH